MKKAEEVRDYIDAWIIAGIVWFVFTLIGVQRMFIFLFALFDETNSVPMGWAIWIFLLFAITFLTKKIVFKHGR